MPRMKPAKTRKALAKLPFRQAVTSLTLLGSLWRTAIAFTVALTTALIIIGQGVYVGMTFNGGAPLSAVLADGFLFYESLKGILVFVLAFFIYDALYVGIVQRYQMKEPVDRTLLLTFECLVLGLLLLTTVVQAAGFSYNDWRAVMMFQSFLSSVLTVTLFGALLLPAVRAVAGVSWVVSRVRVRKRA